jgi:hypothetical protein
LRQWIGGRAHRAGAATRADIRALQGRLEETVAELERTRQELAGTLAHGLAAHEPRLEAVETRAAELGGAVDSLAAAGDLVRRQLEDAADIAALRTWIAHAPLGERPLISIVMPTRDRLTHLSQAIGSVLDQRYDNWELLVVDDSGCESSRALVEGHADPRIRWFSTTAAGRGACAARNIALRAARGSIIGYLDDDNMMDRDWLQAVAWAFEHHPEQEVLYGAFVIDDMSRLHAGTGGELPRTILHRWNRPVLSDRNLADIGAIAHRAGLPGAWFDEDLVTMGDWDLLTRLTAERDPLVLPAVACLYTTDAPNRLSGGPTTSADTEAVSRRVSTEAP